MNNITKRLSTAFLLCLLAIVASAQLEVKKDLYADSNETYAVKFPVKDTVNNETCALIIVNLPLDSVTFKGNIIKQKREDNGYWIYVTPGTSWLDIIPAQQYHLNVLEYKFEPVQGTITYKMFIEYPRNQEAPKSSFTASVGFNALSIMGPSVSIGAMFHNFTIEAGAVYGLNKSKDVYIYDQAGTLADGYSYSALRGFLRVGYDIWAAPVFAITPQVGAAFTSLQGSRLSDIAVSGEKVLNGGTAISGTVGVRLMFAPSGKNGTFRVFLTPEYDFAASKDKNFEALSKFDSTIKGWADGLNVNMGLMFYF